MSANIIAYIILICTIIGQRIYIKWLKKEIVKRDRIYGKFDSNYGDKDKFPTK